MTALQFKKQTAEIALVRKQGRILVLMVQGRGRRWQAMALDGPQQDGVPFDDAADRIFADHAHTAIGEYPRRKDAVAACERHRREWARKGRRKKRCECKEIGAA